MVDELNYFRSNPVNKDAPPGIRVLARVKDEDPIEISLMWSIIHLIVVEHFLEGDILVEPVHFPVLASPYI